MKNDISKYIYNIMFYQYIDMMMLISCIFYELIRFHLLKMQKFMSIGLESLVHDMDYELYDVFYMIYNS